jgi:hypothetical protein
MWWIKHRDEIYDQQPVWNMNTLNAVGIWVEE